MNWVDFLPYLVVILIALATAVVLVTTPTVLIVNRIKEKKRVAAIVKQWELEDAVAAVLARREAVTA